MMHRGRPPKYPPDLMVAALTASQGPDKQESVALRFGVPPSTLQAWRRKAGLLRPKPGGPRKIDHEAALRRHDAGETMMAIANDYDVSVAAVSFALKKERGTHRT